MASGTVKATEVSGEKNIVAQIAQLSWEKVKSAEKMAGAEKKYAKNKLRVGEEGGLTQEEFSKKYGRGSFFRKALGSQFGGDKIARNRGRVESFFDKDVPGGRDATKSRQGRYREGFNYPDVEPKNPIVGRKPKAGGGGGDGERKSTRSNRAAISEAMASALAGIEIQLTRLSEKFTNTVSVPEGLTEIINKQSQVITAGFDGLSKALYTLLGSIQKQTATMVRLDQEQKNLDAKNIDRQQALDEESALEGMGPGAGNLAAEDITSSRGGKGGGGGILGKMFGASVLARKIGRRGAGRAGVRAAAALGGRGAAKFMTKGTAKAFGKAGLKSGLKKIPLLGLGVGAFFAAQRAMKGDMIGAGLELASGAASIVPGAGTAASLGVDGVLAARDAGVVPFAKGGMVTKPTLGIVGEGKDPELITPWNKKTFDMMNKARLDAIQKNKNKFADVQAEGLKEYYENRGGWQKFGETLITLLKGAGGIFDPNYQPGPPQPEPTDMLIPGDAPPEIKALMETISGGEGGPDSVNAVGEVAGLSNMTIDQAIEKGLELKRQGKSSGALGAYQMMPQYLRDRAVKAGFDPSKDKFSMENQTQIMRTFMVGLYGQTEETLVRHLQEGKLESHIFPKLGQNSGWPSLPGGSQPNVHTAGAANRYTANVKKYERESAAPKQPPAAPTPKTDWAAKITQNFGYSDGEKLFFTGPDNVSYHAVKKETGWQIYRGGIGGVGGTYIETTGTANKSLEPYLIKAGQEKLMQSRGNEQASALAQKSQEVAMARTGGPNVQVSVVNTGGGGSAVPQTDSATVGPARDAFVNLSLDARNVG
jgi:muramidase (phage lysozyme)